MVREDRSNEAAVQFELYRLIKNNICIVSNSRTVHYDSIEPEKGVRKGSVDLVVWARKKDRLVPFLVLEVKRPSLRSFLLYTEKSVKQIEGYAKELQAQYSILTDGIVLRLFKRSQTDGNYIHIGNYSIELNDNKICLFLTEMLEYDDSGKKLSMVEAPSFSRDKFERELTGLTKTLRALFEQLGLKKGFSLRHTPKPRYLEQTLSYDVFRDMLSLSLEREKRDRTKDTSFLFLSLTDLRNKLGPETLHGLLVKLSQIECFKWIKPEKAEMSDKSTWKNLRDIPIKGELKPEELEKQMDAWFMELTKLTKHNT